MITFYDFSVPVGGGAGTGSLVSGGSWITATGNITYPTEIYDDDSFHADGTNEEEAKFEIPTGVSLVRMTGCTFVTSGNPFIRTYLTNAGHYGQYQLRGYTTSSFNPLWNPGSTGPIAVSDSDYFQLRATTSISDGWGTIEVLPSSLKYCTVRKSADQASIVGTQSLSWDTEVADVGGWHDNVTNNERLTVPSAVTRVRLSCNIVDGTAYSSTVNYFMDKNAGNAPGLPRLSSGGFTVENYNLVSAVIAVTSGDYFRVRSTDSATTRLAKAEFGTWFSIEDASTTVGALVYKGATQSVTVSTATAIAFASEAYDDANIHDNSTNNTRLTIPSGYTRARLTFGVETANASGVNYVYVRKNGSGTTPADGLSGHASNQSTVDYLCGRTAWLAVSPGDYFELVINAGATQTLPASDQTYFGIELA